MTTRQKRAIVSALRDGFRGDVTVEHDCFEGRVDAVFTEHAHEPILISTKRELGETSNLNPAIVAGIRLDVTAVMSTVK